MYKQMLLVMLFISVSWQFKTALKTQVTPLETILSIDPSNWTCENPNYREQLNAEHDIEQWIDILKHKDGFDGDLQVLAMVKALVDKVLSSVQHIQNTFVQVKHIRHQLTKHFKKLSEIESFKLYDINDILGYVEVLNKAKTDEDKLQLATTIANKIAELIQQITEIQLQLNTIPVEIDQLYDLSIRVNQKTQACKEVWAPYLEADNKVEDEKHRQEEEQEQARLKAEEEAKIAQQARLDDEKAKLAEQEEIEKQKIQEQHEQEQLKEVVTLTPEEAHELENQAEQELEKAEEEEKVAQQELQSTKEAENLAEKEAEEAAQKAAAAQQTLDDAKEKEEEACVDAEEAERRLQAAREAAEQAKKMVEEAERLAEEARKSKECETPIEPPLDEPIYEEFYEETYYYEEEDSCTDDALQDLIDTLIDSATEPSAYQPSCGYPGCQEQPIIIIVEDDDEEKPQPKPQTPAPIQEPAEEPKEEIVEEEIEVEPTPDDDKIVEEEEIIQEEIVEEELIVEEIVEEIYEEILMEEDDDFGRLEYPEEPVQEIQYLIYKSDEKHINTIDQVGSKWEVEVNHGENTKIKGSVEYSYGLWTYFRYNGEVKISEKKEILVVGGLKGDDNDRLLTTIGEGVYNFKVFENDKETELQIDYGKYLDAEWVYVYFGYKEGKAIGYIYWARTKIIKTVSFTVNYEKIVNKIRFQSGYWTGYKGFNGIITNIRVVLNKDAYIEDEIIMKNTIETEYPVPQQDELEYIEEQHYDKIEYDSSITEPKFHWDLDGYREYSISTWFRYVRRTQKSHQIIFRLTSNEPDSGDVSHGDRVLSLWQTEQNEYEFETYTVEEKDKFSQIKENVIIDQESQQLWTFAYFGYNNEDLEYYMEWPDQIATKKFKGWHIVAKYWALYLGQGLKHFFHGKTAYTTIRFGKGSFGVSTEFENYKIGKIKLWPGVQEKKYDAKLVNHSVESEYDTLLQDEQDWITDGIYEYGFGLWTKFFITNPQRIYEKPDRILIAKLLFSDDIEFSVYIGKGEYEFFSQSVRPIKYSKNLDGYWNYIYFSYSKLKQIAVGYVNFNKLQQIQRTVFDTFDSDPFNNYARFYIGKSNTIGFNGRITNCIVRMGRGSFINEIDEYQIFTEQYPVPIDEELGNKDFEIQGAENKDLDQYNTYLYEDAATETLQYSIYGWFKYYGDLEDQDPQTIIRLTNNELNHLQDQTNLGDRTLTAIQQGSQMIFGTYDIGYIDTEYIVNKQTEVELGEYRGLWMYIWVGYSRNDEQFGWFLGFPDISKGGVIKKILHFSPKYLAIYFGNDGINKQFNGKSRHIHACYGQNQCWYFVNKVDIDDQLPAWLPYKLNNHFEYFIENDNESLIVSKDDQPALDIEFTQTNYPGSDLEAIYEYGIGIWTRWLMNYPYILLEKSDSHSIFRFTSNAQYEDSAKNGDRTISSFVGRGEYQFSTYDAILNKNEIITGTKFDQELEGYWNFVYFCYKRIPTGPKGIGYVYLSNINAVKRVEIDSAKHWLLRDYARLVIGKKEFKHSAFQGKLFDPRAFLGQGSYIESSEDLINQLLPKFRNYPPYKEKQDNEPIQVEKIKIKERIFKSYEEKYSGVFEYSVYGFAKGNKLKNVTEWTTLVRVTQNTQDIQSDNDNAGDRTLSIFIDKDKWIYSTYDYGDIEVVDDDVGAINHEFDIGKYWGKWTYFYFGYSFKLKQAYAYIRQIDQTQNSYLFENVYHFVPNYLSVFFADDGYSKMFDGEVFDWYLGIGDGAFTTNPEPNQWPIEPLPIPDRILSALLANQGFNSGRIVKSSTFLQIEE